MRLWRSVTPASTRTSRAGPIGHRPEPNTEKREEDTSVTHEGAPTPDGEEPTEHGKRTLRRVGESLPASANLIAIVELTERFTFYSAQGLFQNYVSLPASGRPAGLDMGHQAATGLNLFFQWFCYVTDALSHCSSGPRISANGDLG